MCGSSSHNNSIAAVEVNFAPFGCSCCIWPGGLTLLLSYVLCSSTRTNLAPETLSNASFWITFIWWIVHVVLVLVHSFGQYDFVSLSASFWNSNIWLFVHCKFELAHSFGQYGALWLNASFWNLNMLLLLLHVLEIRMFEFVHGFSQHVQLDSGGWPPWVEHGLLAT